MKPPDIEFWSSCSDCFSSVPCGQLDLRRKQAWFTKEHTHDHGAVQYSMIYTIPGISLVLGDEPNMLVNKTRLIADNRAGDYIEIVPSNYKGTEEVTVEAI